MTKAKKKSTPKAKPVEPKPVENVCCTCGRCGRKFVLGPNARYTTLCKKCRVPHQSVTVTATSPPPFPDEWRCDYCGQTGPLMVLRASDCSAYYPACESCGGHPYCTSDCRAMLEELAKNPARVIGFESS
jgi:hypothetical protein